jgi:G:T-mismatch repair DNA endonuclease (very short patch repair protein)
LNLSKALTGKRHPKRPNSWNRNIALANLGKTFSKQRRLNISKAKKGIPNPKVSKALKLRCKDEKFKAKIIKHFDIDRQQPNNQETMVLKLLRKLKIRYRYTGNGQLIVGGFKPDIKLRGQKKLIEVYGGLWHASHRTFKANDIVPRVGKKASDIWKKDARRIRTFKKAGYQTLVIWEREFRSMKMVEKKILRFENEM